MLKILDLKLQGFSHRQIAIELFGLNRVKEDWFNDSALRASIRRRIQKATSLMEGDYKQLIQLDS